MKKLIAAAFVLLACSVAVAQQTDNNRLADPCQSNVKSYGTFSGTASARIITGVAAKKVYVCSFNLVTGAATNIAIVEGTGSTCGTNTVTYPGLSGGTTAATGWNFAANGGIAFGNGTAALGQSTVAADDVCLLLSAANQTSGGFSYVTAP